MELIADDAYAALTRRDRRYDGAFFVGVTSTGIYCRPVCPARTPGRARCEFYRSAVEAERDGFRPCLRCRPEHAPGVGRAPVDATDALLRDALRRIDEALADGASLDELAAQLGVSARHLRRVFHDKLGASPVDVLQSRRLALATQLLRDTAMPVASIAFASGFRSVRRFNEALSGRYGATPTALRAGSASRAEGDAITLRLDYRPPLDFARTLKFLSARAIPGVESVHGDRYARVVALHGVLGVVELRADPARPIVWASCSPSLAPALMPLVARLRALFDLDANPEEIRAALGGDPRLARSLRAHPGLRVPGHVSAFELAVRAVLGQQVSVAAATTLSVRLCDRLGEPLPTALARMDLGLTRAHPTASALRDATVEALTACGIMRARAETLRDLGACFAQWGDTLPPRERFVAELRAIRGVGEWTTDILAMRGWHDTDAFPSGDLMILRALGVTRPREAAALAEAWRPYRAYAAIHLWQSHSKQAVKR